jgi:septum formation protein
MLRGLAGRTHKVVTGVAIMPAGASTPDTFAVTTQVAMRALDDEAIEAWIARGEYLGCAGAYNIEHHLASVADDECYQNVAGLPLCHLYAELASGRAGSTPEGLVVPIGPCDAALSRSCRLGPRVCGDHTRP